MYAWIWRHLPFGLPGKIGGSVLLAAAFGALLWYVVFPLIDPWVEEPLLPWDRARSPGTHPGADIVDGEQVAAPTASPSTPTIPYETRNDPMRVLVIDNYDSFVYNLVQYLGQLGAECEVRRNDEITVAEVAALRPAGVLLSPGPGTPDRAGVCLQVVSRVRGRRSRSSGCASVTR